MDQSTGRGLSVLSSNENAQRVTDRDARALNISGARGVAEIVRTTLGPKGLDKLLVNSFGQVILTNDGATVLDEMEIVSPAGTMIADVARIQEEETGDGTTSAVVIAGELLKAAQGLIDRGVHPATVATGYHTANEWARAALEGIARPVDTSDTALLGDVALTSMTGRYGEQLADLAVQAVTRVVEGSLDRIEIETQPGRAISDSELLDGVVVNKDPLGDGMPTTVEDARVLLLYQELETDTDDVGTVSIDDPVTRSDYVESEEEQLARNVERIADAGTDVVFFMRGVDDLAVHMLQREGILGVNRIKKSDLEEMGQVLTGSPTPIWEIETVTSDALGRGRVVRDERAEAFYVSGPDAERVTLLARGVTEGIADEIERSVADALSAVALTVSDGLVIPGGGATEIELARRIRSRADSIAGREQLAIGAYADALERIPWLLAENAGLDPIDPVVTLRAAHDAGDDLAGLDVTDGGVIDAFDAGIIEPLHVKRTAYTSATDVANTILAIDDVISAGDLTTEAEVDEEELAGPEEDYDTADMGGTIDPDDWMNR